MAIRQEGLSDPQADRRLTFFPNGARIVEEDEVGSIFSAHVGEIVSAELVGEKDGGAVLLPFPLKRVPAEGDSLAGGGGEEKVLRHPLQQENGPRRTETPGCLGQTLLQRAAGDAGGIRTRAVSDAPL